MNCTQTFLVLVIFLQVFLFNVTARTIPSFVHLCKRNDPELNKCIINTFNEIRPHLVKGIPEMELPPGEPLGYINVSANAGGGTAVSLEIRGTNITTWGLMGADIKNLTLDLDRPLCQLWITFPYIKFEGIYGFKGRILVMEVNSMGPFTIVANGITARIDLAGKYRTREGKEHLEFQKEELKLQIEEVATHFDGLIGGNEILTATLNQAINENIADIVEELKPVIEETLGRLARQYFNLALRAFPIDELFPRD